MPSGHLSCASLGAAVSTRICAVDAPPLSGVPTTPEAGMAQTCVSRAVPRGSTLGMTLSVSSVFYSAAPMGR